MELKDLVYETRNQAAWLTLNRPRVLNALSVEMLKSLRRAFEAASEDRDVRAVVITGAGRGFCSGQDVAAADARNRAGSSGLVERLFWQEQFAGMGERFRDAVAA